MRKYVDSLDVVTAVATKPNAVKKYADENKLSVLAWPPDLGAQTNNYDLGVVVSFGHLIPKKIINHFPLGMINVHASLLPRWRGASPIVHSILHGDRETGISIMRINPNFFDTGDIILQQACSIGPDELMPSLYEKLGKLGASALIESLSAIANPLCKGSPQNNDLATYAPRINTDLAVVRWEHQTSEKVYNLYRALFSIYDLKTCWHHAPVKLKKLKMATAVSNDSTKPGRLKWHRSNKELTVQCKTGSVVIDILSIGGKSLRGIDFYNGYLSKKSPEEWYFV